MSREVQGIVYEPYREHRWDAMYLHSGMFRDYTREDWLHIELARPAQVMVLWDGDEAGSWLSDWDQVVNDRGDLAFVKSVPAGELVLGAKEGKGTFNLYFGEADSSAPQMPAIPDGMSTPVPNELCPEWVHDTYTAVGPDSNVYRTWHPQVDPRYWCYFGHEHGSDPQIASFPAAFGYVAFNNYRQDESHRGFKGFVVKHGSVYWYINFHALTGAHRRACVDLHTVVFSAFAAATGEKLAEIAYKGDFGESRATVTPSGFDDNPLLTNPNSDCNQSTIAEKGTRAEKEIRVLNDERFGDRGYEKWRLVGKDFLGLSFNSDFIEMDIRDPMSGCDGLACEQIIFTGSNPEVASRKSIRRTLNFRNGITLYWQESLDPDLDGFFCTDAKGNEAVEMNADGSCPDNSVRQFIKPGVNLAGPTGFYSTDDAWHGLYEQNKHVVDVEIEDSLEAPN